MLEADETIFPANIIKWTAGAMRGIDPDISVFKRPLRNTDPQQSIGVSARDWSPDPRSIEMQGIGSLAPQLPTIQEYVLNVQAFVKDSEQERGLAVHANMSHRARSVLYTDPNLRIVLGELSATTSGMTESVKRWGVRTARYFSGEIASQMLYLSTLEFWVETETRQTN